MKRRVLAGLLSLLLLIPTGGWSQPQPRVSPRVSPESDIPKVPTAPPTLFQKVPPESFRCQRTFTYNDKTYGCDSNVRADGERLRPILQSVPAATSQLNVYQRNRTTLQRTAYFGSLGVAVLIAGLLGGDGNGKQLLILSGSALAGGSFLYGFTSLRANESNLSEAVRLHNEAKPKQPIDLQFSTGITF